MEQGRDPRTVVTPDAFSVSERLVGLPLARPRTRLAAILVDLIVVSVVSRLGWTMLGVLGAFYFFRMSTRKSATSVFTRAAQYSMGCAGAVILGVTLITATGFLQNLVFRPTPTSEIEPEGAGFGDVVSGIGSTLALQNADSEEEAFLAAVQVGRAFQQTDDATPPDLTALLDGLVPDDPDYDRDDFIERVVAEVYPPEDPVVLADVDSTDLSLPLADALERYAELNRLNDEGSITPEQVATGQALGRRIRAELSGDSIAQLNARIDGLRDAVRETERDLDIARQRADAADERRGFFAWIYDTADELGLAFGWGALYFSAILALTNGLTPGKRLFRLRVVRLNGEPMSWFMAFERSGGYAAGFATGLLGFAHILWDPNRMGIHDKIAETVVIKDGAPKIPGAWSQPRKDVSGEGITDKDAPDKDVDA